MAGLVDDFSQPARVEPANVLLRELCPRTVVRAQARTRGTIVTRFGSKRGPPTTGDEMITFSTNSSISARLVEAESSQRSASRSSRSLVQVVLELG